MAVTSRVLACSSINVPTCPGRSPSGGTNSTTTGSSLRNGAVVVPALSSVPNTTSAPDPRKRRSRPRRVSSAKPTTAAPSSTPAGTSVFGRAAKPTDGVHRCSRMGWGVGEIAPGGKPTTTVSPA